MNAAVQAMNFNCIPVSACDPEPFYAAKTVQETELREMRVGHAIIQLLGIQEAGGVPIGLRGAFHPRDNQEGNQEHRRKGKVKAGVE